MPPRSAKRARNPAANPGICFIDKCFPPLKRLHIVSKGNDLSKRGSIYTSNLDPWVDVQHVFGITREQAARAVRTCLSKGSKSGSGHENSINVASTSALGTVAQGRTPPLNARPLGTQERTPFSSSPAQSHCPSGRNYVLEHTRVKIEATGDRSGAECALGVDPRTPPRVLDPAPVLSNQQSCDVARTPPRVRDLADNSPVLSIRRSGDEPRTPPRVRDPVDGSSAVMSTHRSRSRLFRAPLRSPASRTAHPFRNNSPTRPRPTRAIGRNLFGDGALLPDASIASGTVFSPALSGRESLRRSINPSLSRRGVEYVRSDRRERDVWSSPMMNTPPPRSPTTRVPSRLPNTGVGLKLFNASSTFFTSEAPAPVEGPVSTPQDQRTTRLKPNAPRSTVHDIGSSSTPLEISSARRLMIPLATPLFTKRRRTPTKPEQIDGPNAPDELGSANFLR